jgi:hypothetical protein
VRVAVPELSSETCPRETLPFIKLTVPVGSEPAVWPTVDVNVTDCPRIAGFGETSIVITSPDDVPTDSSAPIEGGFGLRTLTKSHVR